MGSVLYKDFIEKMNECPFCKQPQDTLEETGHWYLTYSLAPYSSHHLLVIPKQHILSLFDLSETDMVEVSRLLKRGIGALKQLGYDTLSILIREGQGSGKSVEHVHYHIIPCTVIGDLTHDDEKRTVLDSEEIEQVMHEVKEALAKS
jgi:histidine triad (HIT) family protein